MNQNQKSRFWNLIYNFKIYRKRPTQKSNLVKRKSLIDLEREVLTLRVHQDYVKSYKQKERSLKNHLKSNKSKEIKIAKHF